MGFNKLIHAPNRLRICSLLFAAKEVEFKTIKELLELSDSVISKHIKVLQDVGYVEQNKRNRNGRSYTWLIMTNDGRKAFTDHVNALKKIVMEKDRDIHTL